MTLKRCLRGVFFFIGLGSATSAAEPKYILFLTADGFRTDYVEWHQPPHIRQLIAEGVRITDVQTAFPSVTTPNMTSLVTGAYPRTTGIACNSHRTKSGSVFSRPRIQIGRDRAGCP